MENKPATSVLELIGRTPLVDLSRLTEHFACSCRILAKLEARNPGGSVKDRVALAMVEDAESRGDLLPGATIIEPTSGNTGVGLALVAAVKGYKLLLTMPETMSVERRRIVEAYGARLVLTPAAEGMQGAIDKAEELRAAIPGSLILRQFENKSNPACHYATTAEEIWRDTDGRVDILVAGVGTGGTLCGTGKRLKELNPDVQLVAVEPASSPVLSAGRSGKHGIQGIGAGFVPGNFDASLVDDIVTVTEEEATAASRMLATREGILSGISSGAALFAALRLAKQAGNEGKNIVVVLPDTGERYLSTLLYAYEDFKTNIDL